MEKIATTQAEHTDKLDSHTDKLDAIIATLNDQSVEIALIKGYLG